MAAVVGGYVLATTLSTAIVALVASGFGFGAMARVDAVLVAMQMSFVVYTGAVMWAFAARSARGAWLGLALPSLLSALAAWVLL